jgi:hypothetical protein
VGTTEWFQLTEKGGIKGMTPKELGELHKYIQMKRQIGAATQEEEIKLKEIHELVDREADRLMAEAIRPGERNDAIKRACKKLGLPWEFFVK